MAAFAATGAIPGMGALGSIVRKGDPKLLLSHTSDIQKMLNMVRNPKEKVLNAPSMAISKQVKPFENLDEDVVADVVMYPYPQKLDPAVNKRSVLYGTDAYTYRQNPVHDKISPPKYAQAKYRRDPRFTEEGILPESLDQTAAIAYSPRFNSLSEFEQSKEGAKRLRAKKIQSEGHDYNPVEDELFESSDRSLGAIRGALENLDYASPESMAFANRTPQNYAELKYQGMLPFDRDNIAAVRLASKDAKKNVEIIKALRRQGIPIVPDNLKTQDELAAFVDSITGLRD